MTDNEIIKALKCCGILGKYVCDEECPMPNNDIRTASECRIKLNHYALTLISRQQAEIERLKIENQSLRGAANSYKIHYNEARAEAVKEFVEKSEMAFFVKQDEQREQMFDILKSHRATLSYFAIEQATDNWIRGYGEAVQDVIGILDNLLKEMAGDTE